MLKFLHHAGTKLEMMLPYKIANNNKRVIRLASVQYYFHTSLLWPVYYDNWRCYLKNNKKNGAFDLFNCVIFSDCQFLRYFFKKYSGRHIIFLILYIYIKLKLGTAKHICLKWVFLPQWVKRRRFFFFWGWPVQKLESLSVEWVLTLLDWRLENRKINEKKRPSATIKAILRTVTR